MTPSDPPSSAIMTAWIRIFFVLKKAENSVRNRADKTRAPHIGLPTNETAFSIRFLRKSL